MIVNFLSLLHPGTRRVQKLFEKTHSRMVHHAILGAWGTPQQATDGSYWPSGHCLLIHGNDIRKPRLPRKNGLAKQTIPLRCIYWALSATLMTVWLLRSQGESLKPSCNLA